MSWRFELTWRLIASRVMFGVALKFVAGHLDVTWDSFSCDRCEKLSAS